MGLIPGSKPLEPAQPDPLQPSLDATPAENVLAVAFAAPPAPPPAPMPVGDAVYEPENVQSIVMTPVQQEVLACKARKQVIFGGYGSSKTHNIAQVALFESLQPGNWGMIGTATGPMIDRSVGRDVLEFLKNHNVPFEYNGTRREVTFPWGSSFHFQSLDVPPDQLKGPNYGWVALDECDTIAEKAWDKVSARVRRPGFNCIARLYANPVPESHWLAKLGRSGLATMFTVSTYDNPFLSPDYIRDLEYKYPPGTPEHDRWMMGKVGATLEGSVYPEWNPKRHIVDSCPDVPVMGWFAGLDMGYQHPFGFLQAALLQDGRLFIANEYRVARKLVDYHAQNILSFLAPGCIIFSDHDAQMRAELAQYGIHTVLADKEVNLGIETVRFRLRHDAILVHRSCTMLAEELSLYRYQEGKEKVVKLRDEMVDTLRYICTGVDSLIEASQTDLEGVF